MPGARMEYLADIVIIISLTNREHNIINFSHLKSREKERYKTAVCNG